MNIFTISGGIVCISSLPRAGIERIGILFANCLLSIEWQTLQSMGAIHPKIHHTHIVPSRTAITQFRVTETISRSKSSPSVSHFWLFTCNPRVPGIGYAYGSHSSYSNLGRLRLGTECPYPGSMNQKGYTNFERSTIVHLPNHSQEENQERFGLKSSFVLSSAKASYDIEELHSQS